MSEIKIATLNKSCVTQTEEAQASYLGNDAQDCRLFGTYGLLVKVPKSARLLLLPINGNESSMYAMAEMLDRGEVPEPTEDGEVILANYVTGDYVQLNDAGMTLFTKGVLNIEAKSVNIKGAVKVEGGFSTDKIESSTPINDAHVHTGDSGGTTGTPR